MTRINGKNLSTTAAKVLIFTAGLLLIVIQSSLIEVMAHGKLMDPMGLEVSSKVAPSSQSDVAIGVTQVSPCGTTLGRPYNRNEKKPRAEYYPGQVAKLDWHTVNQDGAGPLRVRFSGDNGASWTEGKVQKNARGVIGLDASSLPIIGKDHDNNVKVKIPNMDCKPGKCMMVVSNPITFGSCAPISIQQGNSGRSYSVKEASGGNPGTTKGIMAGGLGGVLDALNL